jgi:glycosyltransferase involved in cell wall biosynthesis
VRIGYFIPGWPPDSTANGIATNFGYLGDQLRIMGHEVFYITPLSMNDFHDDRVTILRSLKQSSLLERLHFKLDFEKALYLSHSNRIAEAVHTLAHENRIELFQMEETHGWARTVIRRVKIPIVLQLSGPWFIHRDLSPTERDKPENLHRIQREGEAILSAGALRAPSNSVLSLCDKYYGPLKGLMTVIPNPIPVKPPTLRWRVDTCDPNAILFVGRFDRHKGADLLLRAFAQVAPAWPKLKLLFVGPDVGIPFGESGLVKIAEFIKRTVPADMRHQIRYLGRRQRSEIEKLRARSYITIVPSRYETFGNTVIEAMAMGCPTIATETGGISEILTHNENGLIVGVDDVDGLAAAIAKLLVDRRLAARLGAQAVQDCAIRFDPAQIAHQFLDFYARVIERYKHPYK